MSFRSWLLVTCTLASGFLLSGLAAADVAPPEDYVETCKVEQKQTSSVECVTCQAIRPEYDNSDRCELLLSPYCYVSVCNAWGGVSFSQVWCRTKSQTAPAVPIEITNQLEGIDAAVVSQAGTGGAPTCAPLAIAGGGSTAVDAASTNNASDGCSVARSQVNKHASSASLACLLGAVLLGLRRAKPASSQSPWRL